MPSAGWFLEVALVGLPLIGKPHGQRPNRGFQRSLLRRVLERLMAPLARRRRGSHRTMEVPIQRRSIAPAVMTKPGNSIRGRSNIGSRRKNNRDCHKERGIKGEQINGSAVNLLTTQGIPEPRTSHDIGWARVRHPFPDHLRWVHHRRAPGASKLYSTSSRVTNSNASSTESVRWNSLRSSASIVPWRTMASRSITSSQ